MSVSHFTACSGRNGTKLNKEERMTLQDMFHDEKRKTLYTKLELNNVRVFCLEGSAAMWSEGTTTNLQNTLKASAAVPVPRPGHVWGIIEWLTIVILMYSLWRYGHPRLNVPECFVTGDNFTKQHKHPWGRQQRAEENYMISISENRNKWDMETLAVQFMPSLQ